MRVVIILFCLLFSFPQERKISYDKSFMHDYRTKRGRIKLIPFLSENKPPILYLITTNRNDKDTSCWTINLKDYKVEKSLLIPKGRIKKELGKDLSSKRDISLAVSNQLNKLNKNNISDEKIIDISDIYLRNNGNAFIVFNLSGNYGLNQELYSYNRESKSLIKITFPQSLYKIHDIIEDRFIAQYEEGGEFILTGVDDIGVKLQEIQL